MRLTGARVLGPELAVPANASRFMPTVELAREAPVGRLRPSWRPADPYVFNAAFDASLIRHDAYYCTTVVDLAGETQLPTMGYFLDRVLPHVRGGRVVDIGCGRGEFVNALRERGIDAVGYDPVLRQPDEHLRARYWEPGEESAAVYVMRCVLPHIPDPWEWVRAMGVAEPDALLLVEYQRLEWMVEHGLWYGLSHDHVNQFLAADFRARFDVVDEGCFSGKEWAWSLIRPATYRPAEPSDASPDLAQLWEARSELLAVDHPVVPWGAAGKGIVLAHALTTAGVEVPFAIDADPRRQGLFMEVSGVRVVSPREGLAGLPNDARIWVCNPNHRTSILASGVRPQSLGFCVE